ncbi:MAG: tRNA (adenosine(37)-N6)-dimethylallyltransferase MiaA [Patescibacteria group bacterium]|nr:tRNA (adenosine(37)-N6)-dimethylallyltransferase MiaA [Patescibacteria group bacterium]
MSNQQKIKNKNGLKKKPKIVVILGPNASGKSDLAVALAKKFNGEIISADSRQVYKEMDIGTGKVPLQKKKDGLFYKGIEHYLIDVVSPKKIFTVTDYQKLGKEAIKEILNKNKLPIICGGTGFYIDALIYEYQFPNVKPNPQLRKKLDKLTTEKLFQKLKKLDPKYAKKMDPFNRRRLIRALEIILTLKKPMPPLKKSSPYEVLKIGVYRSAQELKKRIEKRLIKRLEEGMIEEIKKIRQKGVSWKRLYDFGLEYRYISLYLQKKLTYSEMFEQLKTKIWQYARRQMIWFRKDSEIRWISNIKTAERLIKKFLE